MTVAPFFNSTTPVRLSPYFECEHEVRHMVCASRSEDALGSILLVGAREDERGFLCEGDSLHLKTLMQAMMALRWPLAPELSVTRCNLDEGHDFLQMTQRADIVLFCFLYNANKSNPACQKGWDEEKRRYHQQSTLHDQEDRWHRQLQKCGAKVVGNIKSRLNDLDLPNEWIARAPYGLVKPFLVEEMGSRILHVMASENWTPARGKTISLVPQG